MSKLSNSVRDEYAQLIMEHLAFHSAYVAPPAGYQFLLPDDRYLTLNDFLVKGKRALYFFGFRPQPSVARQVSAVLARPRRQPADGAWFEGASDRERRKALRTIGYAVGFAYGGEDTQRLPNAILIDPRTRPTPIGDLPGGHRRIGETEGTS